MFKVYFPDRGETIEDAIEIDADGVPPQAAELAAAKLCQKDVEWSDHTVVVSWGETTVKYHVECRSEPVFTASQI